MNYHVPAIPDVNEDKTSSSSFKTKTQAVKNKSRRNLRSPKKAQDDVPAPVESNDDEEEVQEVQVRRKSSRATKPRQSYVVPIAFDVDEDDDFNPVQSDSDSADDSGFDSDDDLAPPVNVATDLGAEEADVHEASTGLTSTPQIDEYGLIRIGGQPMPKPTIDARSMLRSIAVEWLQTLVKRTWYAVDQHFPFSERLDMDEVRAVLTSSLIPHKNDRVQLFDAYTGRLLSWSPGPFRGSIEALYPFASTGDHISYHTAENVAMISFSLNVTKRQSAAITQPLVSAWLRTCQEDDFEKRKGTWTWIMNALNNMAVLTRLFKLNNTHKRQIAIWSTWSTSTRRAVLEMLRTGRRLPELDDIMKKYHQEPGTRKLLAATRGEPSQLKQTELAGWEGLYHTLVQTAAKHGDLSESEYREYLTIPSPRNTKVAVFYPYHVSSRPQAVNSGWDWNTTVSLVKNHLRKLRTACNLPAQKAGFGEPWVTEKHMVCWMVAVLSNEIRVLKATFQGASREFIAFHILDRWALPRVPWIAHPFKLSLCKKQDHGIAMRFGIANVPINEFDPDQHLDLTACTISMDAWTTNIAMFNFHTSDWNDIRDHMHRIPLHHPFWRVDQCLGDEVWHGE